MGIVYGLIALVIIILIHESGHFSVAKLFHIYVERFSIGFGPAILRKKGKETEYVISAIPLGGYVKLKGENPEEGEKESLDERAFCNQKLYKRFLVILAGPMFNILSAVLFFAVVYAVGVPTLTSTIGKVNKDTPAYYAHLQKDDKIIAINNKSIKTWEELSNIIKRNAEKTIILKIKRNEKIIETPVTPKLTKIKDLLGYEKEVGIIGITPSGETIIQRLNVFKSIGKGACRTAYIVKITILGIIRLIERAIPASSVGGPILIIDIASKAASAGFSTFLALAAIISINLGILNLLPIPILDGGHLTFLTIEAIRRKPVPLNVQVVAQNIGLAILILIMVFAFYNDLSRIFIKK
ncbi:MAG: RIP metalloprotease RseP [Deltaproteobacteria bacterium]|nr:RIP metalloprotease RseP [Deltaproteobacteria bacterium]